MYHIDAVQLEVNIEPFYACWVETVKAMVELIAGHDLPCVEEEG